MNSATLSLALLVTGLLHVPFAWYVWRARPERTTNRAFALFTLSIATWIIGLAGVFYFEDLLWSHVIFWGAAGITFWLMVFCYTFPNGKEPRLWFYFHALPAIAVCVLAPLNLIVSEIQRSPDHLPVPINAPYIGVFVASVLYYMSLSVFFLARRYVRSTREERTRLKYFMLGLLLLIVAATLCNTILPAFGIFNFNVLGPMASIVFVACTTYAIVRHQLLDIRIVIQRGIIYSLLLGLITGLYICLMQVLRYLLPAAGEFATFGTAIVTIVIGIVTVPYIERFFRRITDRVFFKDTYEYATALHRLSEVLHVNITFTNLVRESEKTLASIFRAHSVHIELNGFEGCSLADTQMLAIALDIDGTQIGSICLGEKRSGDAYTAEDLQLVRTFAYHASTALSRAQLYADARKHASELAAKVSERTQELSEAHERERQMINDISHNLQTPLTVLQTKLDRLKPTLKDDTEVRSFEQSLSGFSAFVYDLLALARLEGGRKSEYATVDMSALMSELAEEIGTIAAASDAKVQTSIDPGLSVRGDIRRLRETIMNIANNALTYLSDGERVVTFSAYEKDNSVVVAIEDTGMGISPEDLPYVFDRFYRGKQVSKELKGTGLGLAIARSIVEQHDGTISAASEYGVGTRIEMRLPRIE